MARSVLEILLTLKDNASKPAKNFNSSLKDLGRSATDVALGFAKVGAGMAAIGVTINKIMDFGEEGAQLIYLQDKFDKLAASIGTTGEALKTDLKEATKGLISDAELVKAAGDLMGLGLAKTSEEAIRLTRVSAGLGMDLNQLVLTLTNQTTMRFDSLNVAVDGFDARLEALKATGMDTNAAFKEAFLQQAEEQLAKIGDVADSDVATFKRLDATVADLRDELKKQFEPILVDSANSMIILLEASEKINGALEDHRKNLAGTIDTYEAYRNELIRTTAIQIAYIAATKGMLLAPSEIFKTIITALGDLSQSTYEADRAMQQLGDTGDESKRKMVALNEEMGNGVRATINFGAAVFDTAAGVTKLSDEVARLAQEEAEARAQTEMLKASQAALDAGLAGRMTQSMENFRDVVTQSVAENDQLVQQFKNLAAQGIPETAEEMVNLKKQIDANNQAQVQALETMRETTAQMIYQAASAGLPAEAALELARSMGLVDEQDYAVIRTIQDLRLAFDANHDSMISAAEGADRYTQAIHDLWVQVTRLQNEGIDINFSTLSYNVPGYPGQGYRGTGSYGAAPFVFNYSPVISTASAQEAEYALKPIVESIINKMGR